MADTAYSFIDDSTIVTQGTIKSAYHQKKTDKDGNKYTVNVVTFYPKDKKIFDDLEPVFKDAGKKFTPSWFKTKEHIIVRSRYNIPTLTVDGEEIEFNSWLERNMTKGAEIKIKLNLKTDDEGAFSGVIYPVCIVVTEDGEPFNAFEGM